MLKEFIFTGLLVIVFFGIANCYLFIAKKSGIIDKPNERSSHINPVIRGAGIIFPLAWLLYAVMNGFIYPWFTLGVTIIAAISFADDVKTLPARVRFLVHVFCFSLLFYQLDLFQRLPWWALAALYVICIGIVNAFNFMDGINGITGMYGLSFFVTLLVFRESLFPGIETVPVLHDPVIYILVALSVFGFYNFRRKAKCFAGDVGSVSIGFIVLLYCCLLVFGLDSLSPGIHEKAQLNHFEFHPGYIVFLAVYGVDSVLTIMHRLILKENIFKAHRRHLYQYLCNEMKWPHLLVALIYAVLQFGINFIFMEYELSFSMILFIFLILSISYIIIKYLIISKLKLNSTSNRIPFRNNI
jgi:UDP-N-acetylmuramyl pentapeptide phosphotransferase/UDP-N-acetylglucosamine-1-phosphate transferase